MRVRLSVAELAAPVLGALLTVIAAYAAVSMGTEIGVGAVLGAAFLLGMVMAFVAYPHLAVAFTIVLFALVPTLKVFVAAEAGVAKDVVVLAGTIAAILVYAFERRPIDRVVLLLVLLFLALYVVNVGSGQDVAWLQGLRLVSEPFLLLLIGLILPEPRRTLRWALGALVVTTTAIACYGLLQQVVGKYTLVEWGYSFDAQVRSLGSGQLRSFGTLDDPFAYVTLLLFGFAVLLFWFRRSMLAVATAVIILAGTAVAFSRASVVILVTLGGLMLAKWGQTAAALLAVTATMIVGTVALVNATGTESREYPGVTAGGATDAAGSANVILNGRISAWEAALGDNPGEWILGRGVGEVGAGAERATFTFERVDDPDVEDRQNQAVDSGYLAAIADIGLVGLAVLLALLGRLLMLAYVAARHRLAAGWVALALLASLMIDALARSAFTGFPTAYLGFLIVGIALAASREELEAAAARSARSASPA